MLSDILSAEYINDYKIRITFEDGKNGVMDFSSYLIKGGVFDKFKNLDLFKSITIDKEIKNIIWDNGKIDIAPEIIYAKTTKTPLPSWMRE